MRSTLLGAAVTGLLTIMLTVPALAAAAPSYVPPNDAAIIQALMARGEIPRTASHERQLAVLHAYVQKQLGAKPEDRSSTNRSTGDIALRGRTPWGRAIALKPGVMTDNALVILVEFDPEDYISPDFPGVFPGGPLRGEIPAPAPGDNTSFWPGPGDKGSGVQHYRQMLFGTQFPIYDQNGKLRGRSSDTMQRYYLEMSKGTYKVTGQVKDWVRLPYPEAWYGRDDADGDGHATGPSWRVATDAVKALEKANPDFDWTVYDHRNPFGIAGPDPNVPDGYVDHLILVHAGVDESAGGGAQGADAIWEHSGWVDGASCRGPGEEGGFQVDSTSSAERPVGVWIGPYTINPEDGGIGVFCHEFAHDLGLPDEYDTSYKGESPSAFWTLMATGMWLGRKWGLGTRPAPMNAYDKTALGFVTPRTVEIGADANIRLKPAATGTAASVAVRVELPSKYHETILSGKDDARNPEFWSGKGNSLDERWMVWKASADAPLEVDVPAVGGALTFDSWYEIEDDYDYGFVQVSADGGATWMSLAGDHTVDAGQGNPGLSGASGGGVAGTDAPAWETETYSLAAYAGKTVRVRFRYLTDGGLAYRGWEITNVSLPGATGPVTFGGADTDFLDPATPWRSVDGFFGKDYERYYIAEYRDHSGSDGALANVYNPRTFVSAEFWPGNVGLHLIYCDAAYDDNNVGMHPGAGAWMVVDAHPVPDMAIGVVPWRANIQVRDAAFGTRPTPDLWLTPWPFTPETLLLKGRSAQRTFDDSKRWWYKWAPDAGVKIDELGVKMTVTAMDAKNLTLRVDGADAVDQQ
jgi:immune inhibitor A